MCRWRLVPRKFLRPLLSFLVFKNLTIYYFIHFCLLIYICRLEYGIIILIPYNVRLLSVLVPFSWYCSTPSKIVILYGSNKRLGQRTFYHTFSLEELPPILFNKNIHYLLITQESISTAIQHGYHALVVHPQSHANSRQVTHFYQPLDKRLPQCVDLLPQLLSTYEKQRRETQEKKQNASQGGSLMNPSFYQGAPPEAALKVQLLFYINSYCVTHDHQLSGKVLICSS